MKTIQSIFSAEILNDEPKGCPGAGRWVGFSIGGSSWAFSWGLAPWPPLLWSQSLFLGCENSPEKALLVPGSSAWECNIFVRVLGVRVETAYSYVNFHFTCLCSAQCSSLNCVGGPQSGSSLLQSLPFLPG